MRKKQYLKQKIQAIGLIANYTVKKKRSGNLNTWQEKYKQTEKEKQSFILGQYQVI